MNNQDLEQMFELPKQKITLSMKIDLIKAKVSILTLKANDHDWQSYVPIDVKNELENILAEINELLK